MPTLRATDASINVRLEIGEALTVVAPAGSSVRVFDRQDQSPDNTVSGATSVFGPYTETVNLSVGCSAGAISYSVAAGESSAINDAVAAAANAGPVVHYITRGSRSRLVVNGSTVDNSPSRMQIHDLQPAAGSLIDPITGRANFALLNVGQQLVAIPGAVSAPYWTDPGPILYSYDGLSGAGAIPASIPDLLEFVTHTDGEACAQFSCPPGYGEGAENSSSPAKRRTQLQSPQFTTRIRVAWDLSFLVPDADDAPYDVATGYNYPMLLWQAKTDNSQPFWTMVLVTTADPDVYEMRMSWLYSDDSSDVSTYRRQLNANSAGSSNSASSNTIATAVVNRSQWYDLRIEMFLDERDITAAAGGEGYAIITLNDAVIAKWSGPTVAYKDIDGNLPAAPRWSLGLYRYEFFSGGVPAGLDELDLDRQTDPAPYMRRVLFRRARLLQLSGLRDERPPVLAITGNRTLTQADNGRTIEVNAGGLTITVPDSLPAVFRCRLQLITGTTSIASSGSALLNGASTTLTRAAASNPIVEIEARGSSTISFVVTGS